MPKEIRQVHMSGISVSDNALFFADVIQLKFLDLIILQGCENVSGDKEVIVQSLPF
jgi:hypothetical protein